MLIICCSLGKGAMSTSATLSLARAGALCLLIALAACEPGKPKPPQPPKAPASKDAVAIITGQRLDKITVIATARYLPRPSKRSPGEVSQAMFACLEKADTEALLQSMAHGLDRSATKQEIANALAFLRSPHGQKFAELEWATAINALVADSALGATEMSPEELAIVDAHTLTPQHTKFVAAAQKALDTKDHDGMVLAVIEKCEKTVK